MRFQCPVPHLLPSVFLTLHLVVPPRCPSLTRASFTARHRFFFLTKHISIICFYLLRSKNFQRFQKSYLENCAMRPGIQVPVITLAYPIYRLMFPQVQVLKLVYSYIDFWKFRKFCPKYVRIYRFSTFLKHFLNHFENFGVCMFVYICIYEHSSL